MLPGVERAAVRGRGVGDAARVVPGDRVADVDVGRRREGEVRDRDRARPPRGPPARPSRARIAVANVSPTDRRIEPRMADPPLRPVLRRASEALPPAHTPRRGSCGSAPGPVYPLAPMTTTRRPDSPARERANELIAAWDGRAGPARQPARAGDAGRPGRRRGAGRRAQAPVDQEGLEDVGARPRDPDDGSDDARGEGHARQGPRDVRQGDAAAAGRPDDPVGRGGLRLPGARRRGEGGAQGLDGQGRLRRHRASRPARRSATSRSPRRGPRSRPAPTRSTWSSTAARSCRATS